jgi:hypothetical protein
MPWKEFTPEHLDKVKARDNEHLGLTLEYKAAKKEFGSIVSEEETRIKALAMAENKVVMDRLKQNEEVASCPLCLEELQAVHTLDEAPLVMACCGTRTCTKCLDNWSASALKDPTITEACFFCREENYTFESIEALAVNGGSYGKGWANSVVGEAYSQGTKGKKRNLTVALKYLNKAADLGNPSSQAQLANAYRTGLFHEKPVPANHAKALALAKKSATKGNSTAQYLVAEMIGGKKPDMQSESYRLCSISAYQGYLNSYLKLIQMQTTDYCRLEKIKSKTPQQEDEKHKLLLISLYWFGKMCEKRDECQKKGLTLNCLFMFSRHLYEAMRSRWHLRKYFYMDPLNGYSHMTLINWAQKQCTKKEYPREYKLFKEHGFTAPWTLMCANCAVMKKNVPLRACASCGVFAYCSKECQVKHWKAGHKADCKGHWIEEFFPDIRKELVGI